MMRTIATLGMLVTCGCAARAAGRAQTPEAESETTGETTAETTAAVATAAVATAETEAAPVDPLCAALDLASQGRASDTTRVAIENLVEGATVTVTPDAIVIAVASGAGDARLIRRVGECGEPLPPAGILVETDVVGVSTYYRPPPGGVAVVATARRRVVLLSSLHDGIDDEGRLCGNSLAEGWFP